LSRSIALVVTIFAGVDGYVNILDAAPFITAVSSDLLAAAPQALFTRSKLTNIMSISIARDAEADRRRASCLRKLTIATQTDTNTTNNNNIYLPLSLEKLLHVFTNMTFSFSIKTG
jgi:hypothetical protein